MGTECVMAYIGLGSNLSAPKKQIISAVQEISKLAQCQVVQVSSLYLSKPMGPQDQDDYINAVLSLNTDLSALELLDALQLVENSAGRIRKENRWDARILDCDIILFGNEIIDNPRLTVPHYGMKIREFVLLPLAEIAPTLCLPCGNTIITLAAQINDNGMVRVK